VICPNPIIAVRIAMNILLLSRTLLVLTLMLPGTVLAKYQLIARLDCPDGEFVIDARPYNPALAGSASLHIRYRYRGIRLIEIHYNNYNKRLQHYLHQIEPSLREEITGWGRTLYLPPAQFAQDEVNRLAACINENQSVLAKASDKDIEGRFLLGLVKTRSEVKPYRCHEIDVLINADSPITDIYGIVDTTIVMEPGGRVMLHLDSGEVVIWGKVLPPRWGLGKPKLQLQSVTLHGKTYDSQYAQSMKHYYESSINTRTLNANYKILSP